MDTSRWKYGDEFPLLDLIASFDFKSESSLSFNLGTRGNRLNLPGMDQPWVLPVGAVFSVIGWLDVHHSCEGHIKSRLRVCLPVQYHEPGIMKQLAQQVFVELRIPADETFDARFIASSRQTAIAQSTDRHGITDRL